MQVYSTVEKDAPMNRTAQRIQEIVLSRFSVYIRVSGEKNDETCRTHANKYLHSICLQIHAEDAPALQPIPEHSGAGNQPTEGINKRRRIEARNTGSNGRQRGGQTPRYPVRRDANPIATRCSSALHRCYNCC